MNSTKLCTKYTIIEMYLGNDLTSSSWSWDRTVLRKFAFISCLCWSSPCRWISLKQYNIVFNNKPASKYLDLGPIKIKPMSQYLNFNPCMRGSGSRIYQGIKIFSVRIRIANRLMRALLCTEPRFLPWQSIYSGTDNRLPAKWSLGKFSRLLTGALALALSQKNGMKSQTCTHQRKHRSK